MCEYQKPQLSQKEISYGGKIKEILLANTVSKMELANLLDLSGTDSSKERKARDLISMVAKFYPVISLSGDKGYHIANPKNMDDDIADVLHQLKDFNSRITELQERCKPLQKYIDRYMKANDIVTITELENKI